jgi:polyhydroxyalkanoate synthesis regulator phasin
VVEHKKGDAQMAQAKNKTNQKSTATAKSRYYVVNTLQETREKVTDTLENYKDNYVAKPLKNGKAFVSDLKTAPRKTITGLVDDGKEMVGDLNKETRQKVDGLVKDGKAFITKAGKDPRKAINEIWDDTVAKVDDLKKDTRSRMDDLKADYQAVIDGIGKDARLVLEEVVETGKKALDKVPGIQKVEKKIRSRIDSLPAQFNLPSKKDIDGLARRVNTLNKKVDSIQKSIAA